MEPVKISLKDCLACSGCITSSLCPHQSQGCHRLPLLLTITSLLFRFSRSSLPFSTLLELKLSSIQAAAETCFLLKPLKEVDFKSLEESPLDRLNNIQTCGKGTIWTEY